MSPKDLFCDTWHISVSVSIMNMISHFPAKVQDDRKGKIFQIQQRPSALVMSIPHLAIKIFCKRVSVFLHLSIVYFFQRLD